MSELTPNESEFILYTDENGDVKLNVMVMDETVWLTQEGMQELFGRAKSTVSEHISNVFAEGELIESATVRKYRTVRIEGSREVTRNIDFYNLDVIISIGYRVKSHRGTQFRIWATQTLKEYILKGFVLNDDKLKQGRKTFEQDYFKELLGRVRSIRANERRIYQQITDIFAECSIDYNPQSETTKEFYASVQNKFHYAISGNTGAEIIYKQADSTKENMGLTTWKNAPEGRILKTDAQIAKNYLQEDEITKLERTVSGFFDYVENIIENRTTFTMSAFADSVNKFLSFNEYRVLEGKGSISAKRAKEKANKEYDVFNKTQKIESDFDREIKKLKGRKS